MLEWLSISLKPDRCPPGHRLSTVLFGSSNVSGYSEASLAHNPMADCPLDPRTVFLFLVGKERIAVAFLKSVQGLL